MEKKNSKQKNSIGNQENQISDIIPQAIDVEKVVLGTIILDSSKISLYLKYTKREFYFLEKHQLIHDSIVNLHESDQPIDMILIVEQLRKDGAIKEIGGHLYITELTNNVVSSANIINHILILWQYSIKRKIIDIAYKHAKMAYDNTEDSLDILHSLTYEIEKINLLIENAKTVDNKSAIDSFMESLDEKSSTDYLITGYPQFDDIVKLKIDNILIIGGPAKHMKTRFNISIMKRILEKNNNVSILWYSMEDTIPELFRIITSNDARIAPTLMEPKLLNTEKRGVINRCMTKYKEWDVEYVNDAKRIREIGNHFASFCQKRQDNNNILIIDNAMLLEDKGNDRDDEIMNHIAKIRSKTKGLIVLIHHFNDDQMHKDRLKSAYRPTVKDFKGREGYRRVPTKVILINKPGMYPELVEEYPDMDDIFQHLFIVDVAANRSGIASQDKVSLIRFWNHPDYNDFEEISI